MRDSVAGLLRRAFAPALLAEARCPECGHIGQAESGAPASLCRECQERLAPPEKAACPGCGAFADVAAVPGQPPELCGHCRSNPRPWGRVVVFGPYDGPLRDMILAYKFERRLDYGRRLQDLLLAAFERGAAALPELCSLDALVPVPLHPARLLSRGFNQSLELARLVASRRGVPLLAEALSRTRRTAPQMTLAREQRAENIRGAFAAREQSVRGRRLVLVDDIITTGATLEECARVLTDAGAARVDVLALARA